MPFTFNGFGTRYSGRSNTTAFRGTCEFCGRNAEISSYDTRLWICAVYVPLVPLGRKRVLDMCSRCRRHRVMPLEEYRRLEDEAVREGESAYRVAPADADRALVHLGRLLAFHRNEEAMAHAEELSRRFPDRPAVLLAIAPVYLAAGRDDEADSLLERAHRTDPSDTAVRQTLAWRHLAAGRIDAARALVDAPGAGAPEPGLVLALARAQMDAGEPLGALSRLRELLARHPHLGQDREFRRTLAAAEKAAGVAQTSLPRRALPARRIGAVAAGVGVVAAIAIGYPYYARTHRTLHLVSAVPGTITVSIDGRERLELAGPGRERLTLAEGSHSARIEGRLAETVDFTLATGFWDGLTRKPVFILDPGGLAVVGREEIYYGKPPAGFKPRSRLFAGRSFFTLEKADFMFREFPESLQIDSRGRSTRSRIFDLPGEPVALANWLLRFGETGDAISYLEAWLAVAPDDEVAMAYASFAAIGGRAARAADTLRPHLATDPINLEWHRAYQEASEGVAEREEALYAEYDRLLAERRADPMAHYLRARIEPDPARAQELYASALRLDPAFEYAARGSAYLALSAGEFERAVAMLHDLVGREGVSRQAVDLYLDALFAAEHDRELAAILEGERTRPPAEVDWDRARRLVLLLVHGGRGDEVSAWADELDGRSQDEATALANFLRAHLLYSSARFDELRALAQRTDFPPALAPMAAFWAAIERGDLQAINRTFEKLTEFERRGFCELILSLAYAREGASGLSIKWQRSALTHLAGADRGYRVFAELVESDTPVTPEALARISVPPRDKATLLTLLAVRRPEAAELALREADRLNFEPVFPHHFLRRFQPGSRAEGPVG